LLWFAWAITAAYLYLQKTYKLGQFGWVASLMALMMFLYGSWLPANQQEITPLVPALVSYWRQIHVPPLICSYALFCLAGLAALAQLWQGGRLVSLLFSLAAIASAISAIALGTYTSVDTFILQGLFVGGSLSGLTGGYLTLNRVKTSLVSVKQVELYDEVAYRCVQIGFPLLTFGIITGGLWANHAWGSYWSWDPKESMALVTWLSYAAYIHLRVHRECSEDKLALVTVAGLILTLLTYLGFNSLGFGGLHSYGKFK
jgi:cytochrome c-type biogenesis protein CcsB